MAILDKGTTYVSGQSVTAANLNNLVAQATFKDGSGEATDDSTLEVSGAGYLRIKDDGVTSAKLAPGAVTASEIAPGAITSTQLEDNTIAAAKISNTDVLLNTNNTHGTIGLGILASAGGSSPKVKMDGGVRIGDQAPSVGGELEVTGNGSANILSVENLSTTPSDASTITVRGPQVTLQLKDTVTASADTGCYNITSDGGYLQISLISDDGLTATGLLRLRPNGNLSILGTLSESGLT